ncbi:MAG: Wzz/FepE/Etk N-terminal domain-containing protein [Pseudomonadota bacterium]|nr:Wzz/FepE/Etk N-terminal domain-containing protein [Pseudomonadota bacterium]
MNAAVLSPSIDLRERWVSYWRRRRTFLAVTAGSSIATVALALLLPPTYRSTATILIEQQEIPQELVRSVITSFADQRVQVISQRVMTTQNLLALVERYDLYPDIRQKEPREVLLDKIRGDIGMRMISADVIDPRSGRPTQATIAFSVSYQNRSPDLALKVANDLTTLYLNENLSSRTQLGQQTATFFSEEASRQAAHIADLDKNLTAFKQKHRNDLPELVQLNLQNLDRAELDLHEAKTRVDALDSERLLLEAQLAQLNPMSQVYSDTGQRVMGPEDRLKALKSQLASYKARFAPNHPDIISTQREVEGLEKEVKLDDETGDRMRQLDEAKAQLARALEKYSPDHPDVLRWQRTVASLEGSVKDAEATGKKREATYHSDNPVYVQVKGQLDALAVDRDSAIKRRDELQARYDDYQHRIASSPEIERVFHSMTRDLEAAQLKYQEILSKQTEVQVSENLESERKGERFTMIEPPQAPEKPVSPNRVLIVALGLLLSVGFGVGAAAAHESFDASVRGPNDIRRILQVAALASIPLIVTDQDRAKRRKHLRYGWGTALGLIMLIAATVHLFVRPLDVLWLNLLRRLGV